MRQPTNLHALRALWRVSNSIPERTAPCWELAAAAKRPRVYVYDVIGGMDNDASDFVRALHQLDAPELDLHINSPGGFVYDGVAMYEALKGHPARVHVHVDGMAASAASFVAMAGDTIEIARGGRMMIHDAQGVGIGSPAQLREYADMMDAVSDDISGYYSARAGGSRASWRKAMNAETWYSADQAVTSKLADRVSGGRKGDAENRATQLIRARARVHLEGVK